MWKYHFFINLQETRWTKLQTIVLNQQNIPEKRPHLRYRVLNATTLGLTLPIGQKPQSKRQQGSVTQLMTCLHWIPTSSLSDNLRCVSFNIDVEQILRVKNQNFICGRGVKNYENVGKLSNGGLTEE